MEGTEGCCQISNPLPGLLILSHLQRGLPRRKCSASVLVSNLQTKRCKSKVGSIIFHLITIWYFVLKLVTYQLSDLMEMAWVHLKIWRLVWIYRIHLSFPTCRLAPCFLKQSSLVYLMILRYVNILFEWIEKSLPYTLKVSYKPLPLDLIWTGDIPNWGRKMFGLISFRNPDHLLILYLYIVKLCTDHIYHPEN